MLLSVIGCYGIRIQQLVCFVWDLLSYEIIWEGQL